MSRYDGVSRYDGGIAGSDQRVLVGVRNIGVDSAVLSDVPRYDGDGGMHGSAHSDLSNVGEKTNDGVDAERVGVVVVGGVGAAAVALCFSFARR